MFGRGQNLLEPQVEGTVGAVSVANVKFGIPEDSISSAVLTYRDTSSGGQAPHMTLDFSVLRSDCDTCMHTSTFGPLLFHPVPLFEPSKSLCRRQLRASALILSDVIE